MTSQEIAADCIKYCLIKARGNDSETAIKKIAKALKNCDMTKESIHECIILLKVFEDE